MTTPSRRSRRLVGKKGTPVPAVVSVSGSDKVSVAQSTASSLASNSPKLHPFKVKRLLQVIETREFGGIARIQRNKVEREGHILDNLLNRQFEADGTTLLFGTRATEERTAARKQVDRWKNFPRRKYLKLCHGHSVIPVPLIGEEAHQDEDDISDLSAGDETPLKSSVKKAEKKKKTELPKPVKLEETMSTPQVTDITPPDGVVGFKYDHFQRPEHNRELFVVQLEEIPGVKDPNGKDPMYDGYGVMVPFDSRWAKHFDATRNYYSAYVFQERCVVVEWPAYPFAMMKCKDNFMKVRSEVPQYIQKALTSSANDFDDSNQNRLLRRVMIEFDRGVKLDATKLDAAAKEGKYLKKTLVAISSEGKAEGFICFPVPRVDTKAKRFNKIEKVTKAQSEEAALAAEMDKLGRDDDQSMKSHASSSPSRSAGSGSVDSDNGDYDNQSVGSMTLGSMSAGSKHGDGDSPDSGLGSHGSAGSGWVGQKTDDLAQTMEEAKNELATITGTKRNLNELLNNEMNDT